MSILALIAPLGSFGTISEKLSKTEFHCMHTTLPLVKCFWVFLWAGTRYDRLTLEIKHQSHKSYKMSARKNVIFMTDYSLYDYMRVQQCPATNISFSEAIASRTPNTLKSIWSFLYETFFRFNCNTTLHDEIETRILLSTANFMVKTTILPMTLAPLLSYISSSTCSHTYVCLFFPFSELYNLILMSSMIHLLKDTESK